MLDLVAHMARQAAFSRATFGPGPRTEGVLDHITKEIEEVRTAESARDRSSEWVDIAILGMDGLWRSVRERLELTNPDRTVTHNEVAAFAVEMILAKQQRNELRDWPNWRTAAEGKAIEHIRTEGSPE